jgi:hypothetical protein
VILARRHEGQNFGTSERETMFTQLGDISAMRTTEIHVTSELAARGLRAGPGGIMTAHTYPRRLLAVHIRNGSEPYFPDDPAYTVNVETDDGFGTRFVPLGQLDDKIVSQRPLRRATRTDKNAAARAYSKYAMLYFVALLVTWVSIFVSYLLHHITSHHSIPSYHPFFSPKKPETSPQKNFIMYIY